MAEREHSHPGDLVQPSGGKFWLYIGSTLYFWRRFDELMEAK